MERKVELLAPAGALEIVKAVIRAGADAVYLGGAMFGARAYANNLSLDEMLEAIDYAHIHGRKIFLTVNTLLKNQELETKLFDYLLPYYEAGLDAVIVQDYGVLSFVKQAFPGMSIHASTQMTVTGVDGARLLKEAGVNRVVTARELSFEEIHEIHQNVDVELESFVHGALCYCYSGQCLLSSMLGGRSGNRGRCAQPCRLPYAVLDEQGQVQNPGEPYILSLKDLNTIEALPQIAESGVYSFKIEGRMKSVSYAAGVVSVYRNYIDRYLCEGAPNYQVSGEDKQRLHDFGNRNGFTEGYYRQWNGKEMLTGAASAHRKSDQMDLQVSQYIDKEIKEKIKGKLTLFTDSHAMMQVTDGVHNVEVTGDIVQKAIKTPMNRNNILEKIQKTGNTPFAFSELDLQMGDNIFLPVAALKNMRQEALTVLEQRRLAPYRRDCEAVLLSPEGKKMQTSVKLLETASCTAVPASGRGELILSTETRAALPAAYSNPYATTIYLDSRLYPREHITDMLVRDAAECKKKGKRVFFMLPAIFRKKTRAFYRQVMLQWKGIPLDGIVVKSYDELAFVKEWYKEQQITDKEIRIDHNMYTYSNRAARAFYRDGAARDTIPLELNKKELRHRDNSRSEFLIYGYLPLMVSAGCVHKNTKHCGFNPNGEKTKNSNTQEKLLYLKDRYEVRFPVINICQDCYNILYNAKPLFLLPLAKELEQLEPAAYRIHFTIESETEILSVLAAYEAAFIKQKLIRAEEWLPDYTNGHYKRGVE